jgi:hypothetical protein
MPTCIQEDSKVILYLGYNNLHVIKVKSNDVYQTKFGALKHNDLIGKEFGSKIQCAKGYVHALPITPGKTKLVESFIDRRTINFENNNNRTMDIGIAASYANSLHAGHKFDSTRIRYQARIDRHRSRFCLCFISMSNL